MNSKVDNLINTIDPNQLYCPIIKKWIEYNDHCSREVTPTVKMIYNCLSCPKKYKAVLPIEHIELGFIT